MDFNSESVASTTPPVASNLSSNVSNANDVEIPTYIVVTSTLLYVLIFFVGIVGNALVIVVICFSRFMKTSVNMYLMNLCVADILVIIVCMPTALTEIYTKDQWYFGAAMCKCVPFLENTVANASVLTILAISIERYRVVCYPLKGIDEHIDKIWKIVILIWVVSVAASTPMLSIPVLRPSQFHDGTPIMVCRTPIVTVFERSYVIILFAMFFTLPCIILFALNCHLCRVFQETQENIPCIRETSQQKERNRRKRQVIKIIGSIVLVFFICHLPFRVIGLWFTFADKQSINSLGLESYLGILHSTRIMFYLNHSLNPVVYNFVSTKFRMALRQLFCKEAPTTSFASVDAGHIRKHATWSRTTAPPSTRQTGIRTNVDYSAYSPCIVRKPRKADENPSNYRLLNGSGCIREDVSTCDKGFDLKIRLNDKTVAIKFNPVQSPS